MLVFLPTIVTMILGRAIDLRTYKVSSNVFNDENYHTENKVSSSKTYHVADNSEGVYKAVGIPADLALHLKAHFISIDGNLNGLDRFLKESIWEENALLIPMVMSYTTNYREVAKDSQPLKNGIDAAYKAKSSHYAKAIQYGGWFALVYKLKTDHPKDMEKVKKEIIDTIGEDGNIDQKFIDSLKLLPKKFENLDLRGKINQEYKLYSSLPLDGEYLEPLSLVKNMNKFPDEVRKRGGGNGDAIVMWLNPLKEINSSFDEVLTSSEYETELFKLNAMFDDLRDTQSLILSWTSTLSFDLTKEQERHISKLLDDVDDAMQVFYTTIPDISLYRKIDKDVLNKAFDAYERTLPISGGTYHLAYRRLKESIDAVCQDSFHDKVLGQLKLDQEEMVGPIETPRGISECKEKCIKEKRCRAIAFGEKLSSLDTESGMWEVRQNICWIHYRSTGTTPFESSSEWIGDVYVYDRKCV